MSTLEGLVETVGEVDQWGSSYAGDVRPRLAVHPDGFIHMELMFEPAVLRRKGFLFTSHFGYSLCV